MGLQRISQSNYTRNNNIKEEKDRDGENEQGPAARLGCRNRRRDAGRTWADIRRERAKEVVIRDFKHFNFFFLF